MKNSTNDDLNVKMKIIPIKTYSNADTNKFIIYKDNKGKSGIYR